MTTCSHPARDEAAVLRDAVAVVSHGTVIALLMEKLDRRRRGFDVWRAMKLPSFAVLSLPQMTVEQVRNEVGTAGV